jgi:hypothetical protein
MPTFLRGPLASGGPSGHPPKGEHRHAETSQLADGEEETGRFGEQAEAVPAVIPHSSACTTSTSRRNPGGTSRPVPPRRPGSYAGSCSRGPRSRHACPFAYWPCRRRLARLKCSALWSPGKLLADDRRQSALSAVRAARLPCYRGSVAVCSTAAMASTVSSCPDATLITKS